MSRKRLTKVMALMLAILAASAPIALAANTVSQTLVGGSRTASVANLTLGSLNYSHSDQNNAGTMTLTADDSTGTGLGWNVTVQSSAFVYSGSYQGSNIPAADLSLTSAGNIVKVAGQIIDLSLGPKVPSALSVPATLDSARKVIQAGLLSGMGTYTEDLGVSLLVPGGSFAGTYTGTMTTTITAAP